MDSQVGGGVQLVLSGGLGGTARPLMPHRWLFTRPIETHNSQSLLSIFSSPHSQSSNSSSAQGKDEDEQCHHGTLKEKDIKQRPWRGPPRAKG
ncbi:hypothetical protein CRYUN_Cryun29cG0108000 [Craigia yunnanensis]